MTLLQICWVTEIWPAQSICHQKTLFFLCFFPRPLRSKERGHGATFVRDRVTSKKWRGCTDKYKTWLSLGSGQLYSWTRVQQYR